MKKLFLLLIALCGVAIAGPDDMQIIRRNAADNGNITTFPTHPSTPGLLQYDTPNLQPNWVTLGSGLTISSNVLAISSAFTPVNADWNSSTGLSQIFNKPSIPAAQVNSDWNASSGVSQVLNKPSIPASQVNSDWASVSGVSQVLNKPTIPSAQVNSDWTASSGISSILNKPAARSQSSVSHTFNSAFQVNSTRDALVFYSVQITVTASILSGQNGDVILEIASDSGFTANVQTLSINGNGQTYTLAVAIQGIQPTTIPVSGYVPAGYYVRLRTVNNTGTPTFTYRAGQELLL